MKRIASALIVLAALSCLSKGEDVPPKGKLLCNEDKTVCVAASVSSSLLANPLRFDLQVNSPGVELKWELRDSTGQVIDAKSTEERMDWQDKHSPKQTLHILDFILKPATSGRGTITLTPTLYIWKGYTTIGGGKSLPELSFPVRLTTARSVVTILKPEDPDAFQDEVYEWADSDEPRQPFKTNIPFKPVHIEVMRFNPNAVIGITAAAVLDRNPGQASWYVTHWSRAGDIAHIGIEGGDWAGVYHYATLLDYLLEESILALPGIKHFVWDSPPQVSPPLKSIAP